MKTSRRNHWERVHGNRPPEEKSWYEQRPDTSLSLIQRVAPPGSRILDVGGGASTLVDHLLALAHSQVGVLDISDAALDQARLRLGSDADRVEWIRADITRYRAAHPWDLWHDRAVYHFLTEAEDRALYLEAMTRSLRSGGHAVMGTFALEGPTRCSGLDVVRYSPDTLAAVLGPQLVLTAARRVVHTTPAGVDQVFNFCVFRLDAGSAAGNG